MNRNNGDPPVTIKADPAVAGEDMQRKSGRPRAVYAYVRSLHHIIPSTFFHLALRRRAAMGVRTEFHWDAFTALLSRPRFNISFPFHPPFHPRGRAET